MSSRSEGKHKIGGNSGKAQDHRRALADAAADRAKARAARSNEEQLALLDARPGEARRERERLS